VKTFRIAFIGLIIVTFATSCPPVTEPTDTSPVVPAGRNSYLEQYDGSWGSVDWVNTVDENDYLTLDVLSSALVGDEDVVRYHCLESVDVNLQLSFTAVGTGGGDVTLYEYDGRSLSQDTGASFRIARAMISDSDGTDPTDTDTYSGTISFIAGRTYLLRTSSYFGSNRSFSARLELTPTP
jgi:hypothetical protein